MFLNNTRALGWRFAPIPHQCREPTSRPEDRQTGQGLLEAVKMVRLLCASIEAYCPRCSVRRGAPSCMRSRVHRSNLICSTVDGACSFATVCRTTRRILCSWHPSTNAWPPCKNIRFYYTLARLERIRNESLASTPNRSGQCSDQKLDYAFILVLPSPLSSRR